MVYGLRFTVFIAEIYCGHLNSLSPSFVEKQK
jgi:hypothetical protein